MSGSSRLFKVVSARLRRYNFYADSGANSLSSAGPRPKVNGVKMKITLPCLICVGAKCSDLIKSHCRLDVADNGIYMMNCGNSHSSIIILQTVKFQLLFQVAINAIFDGYYRESVLSFQGSIERFYEFYIRVLAHSNKIDEEQLQLYWKEVRLSEREFGAFATVYLLQNKKSVPVFARKKVGLTNLNITELRNAVVHRGFIPNRATAIAFGDAVLDYLKFLIEELKVSHSQAMVEIVAENSANIERLARESVDVKAGLPIMGFTGIRSLVSPIDYNITGDITSELALEERLRQI